MKTTRFTKIFIISLLIVIASIIATPFRLSTQTSSKQKVDWEIVYDFNDEGFFRSLFNYPDNPSMLFVTNQSGFYFSDDYGKKWIKKTNYFQFDFVKPYKNNVFAGIVGVEYKKQRGLYISYDNGNTFSQISSPINQELKKEAICPYDFEQNRKNSNILYFAHCYGLSVSTDKGKNWKTYKDLSKNYEMPFYSIATTNKKPETIICAGIDKWNNNAPYVIKSDNSGTNWKIIYQEKSMDESLGGNYTAPIQVEIDKVNPKIIYLRVDKSNTNIPNDDFFYSINEGNSWKKIEKPIPDARINSLCYSEALECLLAATSDGIYQFDVETENWKQVYFSNIISDSYGDIDLDFVYSVNTDYGCDLYTANRTILYRLQISLDPILYVSTHGINFKKVLPDDQPEDSFTITNTGQSTLEGEIDSEEEWISLSEDAFELEEEESLDVTVTIDPSYLSPGKHTGWIDIVSNGGEETIKVTLEIEEQPPSLLLNSKLLDFQSVSLGAVVQKQILVKNAGGKTLTGSLQTNSTFLSISPERFSLTEGETETITVSLDTDQCSPGMNAGHILCTSNGGEEKISVQAIREPIRIELIIGKDLATVNGNLYPLPYPPIIENGRTLVPLRFLAESIKLSVEWDSTTSEITLKSSRKTILLKINSRIAYLFEAGKKTDVLLDVAPAIRKSTTIIPLRFVSENMDAKVEYEAKTQKIIVER